MGAPYVYKIESINNEFYFGVRWCYDGIPQNDLWKNYFTSSKTVKEKIQKNGVNYFNPTILKVFDKIEDALHFEYTLIKENKTDKNCLNRAVGKCAIWNDELKAQVSNSLKKLSLNEDYRKKLSERVKGEKNHNYGKKPWENVNSSIHSWIKIIDIYNDYTKEKWDINKYGYGREFLVKRYSIAQGTARSFIKLLKNNWNPLLDKEFLLFLQKNAQVS